MSFLEYTVKTTPTGLRKLLYLNWPLVLLTGAVAAYGAVMLYSVAGGSMSPWAGTQIERFALGLVAMFAIGLTPIWFWRNMSVLAFVISLLLLVIVEFYGITVGGAKRWLDIGFMRLQPSEMAKITTVMVLAAYYEWLPRSHISRPLFVAIPVGLILLPVPLILRQPDLGTALLLVAGGGLLMFLAGVHWLYFAVIIALGIAALVAVFTSRGTDWQLLRDYHYDRIDVFLDPSLDPLGSAYQITQAQIALGAGGMSGRGLLQGTQTQNDFLLENHTDFIFVTLAEELGFIGAAALLVLYGLIMVFCFSTALQTRDRFASLVSLGVAVTFFLLFGVNMAMVMGLAPVVGLPLPLVSYGGTSMLVLMAAFGLVQSAHVHRPR